MIIFAAAVLRTIKVAPGLDFLPKGHPVHFGNAFQAFTPCLSNATCSSFAIGASRRRYGYSVGCRCYAMPWRSLPTMRDGRARHDGVS